MILFNKLPQDYRIPLLVSLGLHLLLIVVMMVQVNHEGGGAPRPMAAVKPIQAVAVNAAAVQQTIQAIQHRELEKKTEAAAALEKMRAQADQLKQQRLQEQQRLAALKAEQVAIQKKAVAQKMAAEKAAKVAAAAAAQKVAVAKALKLKQTQLADQLLSQQLATEQNQIQQTQQEDAKLTAMASEYSDKISKAIGAYWNKPEVDNQEISAVLLIDLGPGGVVLSVRLVKSSGNAVWDRQALAAAQKASPLPVPSNPRLFDKFRELRLTVRPS